MYRQERLTSLLAGKRILIAGYGREGRSTEHMIRRLDANAHITIADGNEAIAHEVTGSYDMIVKSPGVPMRMMAGATAPVTSQTDLFLQVFADIVIGVTGTKGKSTTASLIHHLLPNSILAGNIGIPLFDIVDQIAEGSLVVAELSCHQLEVLHRSPHFAVVLNLFQEHLDHYDDYMGYKMAKMQIGLHQSADDHLFYCSTNDELAQLIAHLPMPGHLHPYPQTITADEQRLLEACPLVGGHFHDDALVACRVAALASGQPVDSFADRMASFHGLHHRLEFVADKGGISWYDDSISTIPEATIAALNALGNVDTLILGGFDRGIDYSPLAHHLSAHPVRNIVLVGDAGRRIGNLLHTDANLLYENDYTRIVPWCAAHTRQGAVCLLSPAAASYDAFKNFEQRGDFFAQQIQLLP